jgi:hypothetical protein
MAIRGARISTSVIDTSAFLTRCRYRRRRSIADDPAHQFRARDIRRQPPSRPDSAGSRIVAPRGTRLTGRRSSSMIDKTVLARFDDYPDPSPASSNADDIDPFGSDDSRRYVRAKEPA